MEFMIHKEYEGIQNKTFYSHGHQSFMSYKILQSVKFLMACGNE